MSLETVLTRENFDTALLAVTTAVIFWYTVETYRLRKESEKNNSLSLTPVPSITFITTEAQTKLLDADYDIGEKDIFIINVGKVPALNIRFSLISTPEYEEGVLFRMIHSNVLLPNESAPVAVTVPYEDSTSGRIRGSHPHPYLIPGMTVTDDGIDYDNSPGNTYWKDYSYAFSVFYDNPYGERFETKFSVDKHGAHPLEVKRINQ